MTGIADQAPAPARKSIVDRLRGRDRLARLVVVGSFLTMFLLIMAVLGLAQSGGAASTSAKDVFNTILPVLASWVGTVLAFYFSSASQELTSASLNQAIGNATGAADGTAVSEKMLPFSKIAELQRLDIKPPDKLLLKDLWEIFYNKKLPNNASISRIMFVEKSIFKFVLHVGPFNAFLLKLHAEVATKDPQLAGAPPAAPPPNAGPKWVPPPSWLADKTFEDMLKDQDVVTQISKLVVFVSATTVLRDAKAALDKVNGAQDVIVTATGNATEPMQGWLTNVDLTQVLQAN